jgi:hypothetical protein
MSGVLGLSFRAVDLNDDEIASMRNEIGTSKSLRDALSTASGTLLTAQAAVTNGPAWDVFQTTPEGLRPIVLWACQTDRGVRDILIRPVGLRAQSMYEVESADAGPLGIVSGSVLMQDGVEVVASPYSAAHMILLTAVRQR